MMKKKNAAAHIKLRDVQVFLTKNCTCKVNIQLAAQIAGRVSLSQAQCNGVSQ